MYYFTSIIFGILQPQSPANRDFLSYMSLRSLRETLLKAKRLELFSASSPCYLKCKMMPLRYPQNLVQMITSHYHTGSQSMPTSHLSTQYSSDHQPATGTLTGLKYTCVFAAYWFTQPARGWGGRFREGSTLGDFPPPEHREQEQRAASAVAHYYIHS